jgi:hypothetical protein
MTLRVPLGKIPLTIKAADITAYSAELGVPTFKPSFAFNLTGQALRLKKFAWFVRF